ncbi:MAG: SMP-30/gluconolactonase/LRE family protein, partial [Dehalococcoidia bacterium]
MTPSTVLATGIRFGEGPRWRDSRLWFSDFYDHAIKTVDESGRVETVLEIAGQPSGLGWLPDGSLLFVSMLDRKLMRLEDGRPVEHADLAGIATFHCNDMVVDAQGRAYAGNFGFDLDHEISARGPESVIADHPTADLALVAPSGAVSIAAQALHFPNGAVITPNGRTLIVAETLGGCLTAFDVDASGGLSNRRPWAQLPAGRLPDGICLDADGHIWVANPLAPEALLVAEGGEVLEVVETSEPCYACMLGGADGRTLFCLTAANS